MSISYTKAFVNSNERFHSKVLSQWNQNMAEKRKSVKKYLDFNTRGKRQTFVLQVLYATLKYVVAI